MDDWLTAPRFLHVDPLGLVLTAVAVGTLWIGLFWRFRARHRWRANPFRMLLGHYWGGGAIALGLLTLATAASHIGGLPVYGTRLAGVAMLVVVTAIGLGAAVGWRFHLAALMRRYEQRYPEVLVGGVARAAAVVKLETPMWCTIFIGAAAYLAFVWHPWNHVFHEGNLALGGLGGYAIGCLVGVLRYGAPPPPRQVTQAAPRRRGSTRRR